MSKVNLEFGNSHIIAEISRLDKALILGVITETQFPNIRRWTMLTIGWKNPPIAAINRIVYYD